MLRYLHIKNFALINEIEIEFEKGLTILSGETGTGKSIIIGSMNAIAGSKLDKSVIREGAEYILIEMIFQMDLEFLIMLNDKYGIQMEEDNEILISRKFNQSGRSIYRGNNNVITKSVIELITREALDIHSQHEHQSLLNPNHHINLLDKYIGEEIDIIKNEMKVLYKSYKEHEKVLGDFPLSEEQRIREMDFLKFEINEIEEANLETGEDDKIQVSYKRVANREKILMTLSHIEKLINGNIEGNVEDYINEMMKKISSVQNLDKSIEDISLEIEQVESLIQGLKRSIENYISNVVVDTDELDYLEERIHLINTLKNKYGQTIMDIIDTLSNKKAKFLDFENYEADRNKLKKLVADEKESILKLCENMSDIRYKAAVIVGKKIEEILQELNFLDAHVVIEVTKEEVFKQNGYDMVVIQMSTNKNEPVMPLVKIASGGELSRVMLAIKSVFAEMDQIGTLIFDEIDNGISGRTAQSVGEKMAKLSIKRQIICITHLPQISAMADTHYLIEKIERKERIETHMELLKDETVVTELARLIGGATITENTLAAAREMKYQAEELKKTSY